PTSGNDVTFSFQQPSCPLSLADRVIVNRPAKHRRIEPIRLVPRYAIAGISPNQLIKKMRSRPAAGERENRKHASPAFAAEPMPRKAHCYSARRYFFGGRRMAEAGGGGGAARSSVATPAPCSPPSPLPSRGVAAAIDSRERNSKSFISSRFSR